jgi:DNA phosphorothioation-associated putative methyltransferase
MDIQRHKTAIKRNKASVPTRWAFEQGYLAPESTVYDWGCGKGKDSEWLAERGLYVISYDPFHAPENTPNSVDFSKVNTIICNYVLNVIECPEQRNELIQNILKKSNENTVIIISVRPDKEINKAAKNGKWEKYKDGFITSHKTFQKGFNLDELTNILKMNGVKKVIKTHKTSGGIICILKGGK